MKKNKIILGVNSLIGGPHHDNGAFLFFGDKYIGINSERLDREKYSCGYKFKKSKDGLRIVYGYDRAKSCIDYCLDYFGLVYSDIDLLVYLEGIPDYIKNEFKGVKNTIGINNHHLTHAYSSFYSSGFSESALLVIDGQGKKIENNQDKMIIQSIFYGTKNTEITLLKETSREINRRIGIGTMYDMVTSLIGFTSEGTTMGLSSYSNKPNILGYNLFEKYNGHIYANDKLIEGISGNRLKFLSKDIFLDKLGLKNEDLETEKIPYGFSSDIAKQLQIETENNLLDLAKEAYNLTKSENLCISGGVGLNSVANSVILKKSGFKNIYILPSTDDSGLALGCALYGRKILYGNENKFEIKNFYFGKEYDEENIKKSFKIYDKHINYKKVDNICFDTANLISKGNVVGWFQGRSESGPRSLGNRSILADPRSLLIRDKVNKIKKREWWRPLAPAVLDKYSNDFFKIIGKSDSYKYMLLVVDVLDKVKNIIPGVTHIDGTARVQIVSNKDNKRFYDLIEEFNKKSGVPILLNTSFNSAGEPIVETPEEAIRMFLSCELDYLIIENYIISKDKIYKEFSFKKPLFLYEKLYSSWKKEIKDYEKFIKKYNN